MKLLGTELLVFGLFSQFCTVIHWVCENTQNETDPNWFKDDLILDMFHLSTPEDKYEQCYTLDTEKAVFNQPTGDVFALEIIGKFNTFCFHPSMTGKLDKLKGL